MSILKDAYIFMGPPGSGKGSVSSLCIQNFGWVQLSTGNLCRKHIAEQTSIGQEIAFAIKSGKLISDSLITDMVIQWLKEQESLVPTVILDGYPRAVAQAETFDRLCKENPSLNVIFIKFSIPDDTVIRRLTNRLLCQNSECQAVYSTLENSLKPNKAMICDKCSTLLKQRDDDKLIAVRERLSIYHKHERELTDFYACNGQRILELNVEAPLPVVFEEFKRMVGLKNV